MASVPDRGAIVSFMLSTRGEWTVPHMSGLNEETVRSDAEQTPGDDGGRYRFLFEHTSLGVVFHDAEGVITTANQAAQRLLGLTLGQLQGRTSVDPRWRTIHPDGSDFPGATHPASVALATGEEIHDVVIGVFHPVDQRYRWLNIAAIPITAAGADRPTEVVVEFEDITERRRMEQELVAERDLFQALMDTVPESIYFKDRATRFFRVNRAHAQHLGLDEPAQAVGKTDADFLPTEFARATMAAERRLIDTGEPSINKLEELVQGSQTYWLLATKMPIVRDGSVTGLVGITRDITALHQAETALAESERRFRATFEQAAVGLALVALDGRFMLVNQRLCAIVGYTAEELLQRGFEEITYAEDVGSDLVLRHDLLAGRLPSVSTEKRCIHKRGLPVWVNRTASLVRDGAGAPAYFVVVVEDISARKAAEEALRRSERKYRLLFEHMTAAFALHEMIYDDAGNPADFRFLEINPAYERITGARAAELIGKTVKQLEPAIEQHLIEVAGHVVLTGDPVSYQRHEQQLGRHYDLVLFRPAPGQFAVVFTDVTERVRAEAALRESEQLLQTLLDAMPDFIYFKDRQSRIIRANQAHASFVGHRDPAQEIGKTDFDFYPREFAQVIYDAEQEIMRTGQPQIGMLEDLAAVAHRPCWLQSTKVPIMRDGRFVGLVGISRDITKLKRAEEILAHQAAVAEDLAQLRSNFVATVSHELRSPLTAIVGYAELLEMQWSRLGDPDRLKMLHHIVASANRQKRLVEELLLLSRLEMGAIVAKTEPVALGSLAGRAAEEIRTNYPGQRIDLEGPADLQVLADPDRGRADSAQSDRQCGQVLTGRISDSCSLGPARLPRRPRRARLRYRRLGRRPAATVHPVWSRARQPDARRPRGHRSGALPGPQLRPGDER